MNKWEIWWANVIFEDDLSQIKRRPVIIIDDRISIVLAIKITSHEPRSRFSGEYRLVHWEAAGLRKESTARCAKLLRLEGSDFVSKIGRLHPVDIAAIQTIISQIHNL